jgi:hypothetical protein
MTIANLSTQPQGSRQAMEHKLEYKGLTNEDKLIDTMIEHDRLGLPRHTFKDVILPWLERCIEVWYDDSLAGYILIFSHNGKDRSLHGYKLIEGHAVGAFKIVREIIKEYPELFISHHASRKNISRLARLLGFKETLRKDDIIKLEKAHESMVLTH